MKIKLIDYGATNLPYRAHENDAGADVYSHENITVPANGTVKIGLKFGLKLPDGYAAFVYPRSSLSSKGITCEIPPIDSGYTGEIHAIVTNHTRKSYMIWSGDRIGQLVVLPIVIPEFVFGDFKERGDGGFGSTGK